jgi:hypothetical protein
MNSVDVDGSGGGVGAGGGTKGMVGIVGRFLTLQVVGDFFLVISAI